MSATQQRHEAVPQHPAVLNRINELHELIKALSTTAQPKAPLLSVQKINAVLQEARRSAVRFDALDIENDAEYERELEWLLVSKATAQTYGHVLNTILQETVPLSDDIWYWDGILSSYRYAGLYSLQTSPLRLWAWTKDVGRDVRVKGIARGGIMTNGWRNGWSVFWGLVREVVREQDVVNIRTRVLSPLARAQNEAKDHRSALEGARVMNANALGLLLGEGMSEEW